MEIEERLKCLILAHYKSLRAFSQAIDLPYPTLDSMLKRGIMNAGVSNVIKVCQTLEISVDALANGEIIASPSNVTDLTPEETELINKYRALDDNGRQMVKVVLETAYQQAAKNFVKDTSNVTGTG